jgi:DNA-directed RNA polymerase subunit RPC12/RpoP
VTRQISCLVCDHQFPLSEELHEEFDGEIKCPECSSRLLVTLKDGKIRRLRVVKERAVAIKEITIHGLRDEEGPGKEK